MKTLSIAFSMILLSVVTSAQTRYDVGILVIPSFSNFHTGGETEHYQFIPLLNYGLRGNLNMNKFAFSTGLLHLTQGTKFEVLHTTPDQPDEPGEYYDFIIRLK